MYELKTRGIRFMCVKNASPIAAHFHNELEIIIPRGRVSSVFINTKKYDLSEGKAIIIFPGLPHSIINYNAELSQVLILKSEYMPTLQKLLTTKYPKEPLIDLEEYGLKKLADDFWHEHSHSPYKQHPLFSMSLIHSFIIHFMTIFTAQAEFVDRESDLEFIQSIINYLSEHFCEPLTIQKISEDLSVAASKISKTFNSSMNMTIPCFINWLRASKAAELLASTNKGVLEISEEVGFISLRNLNRTFQTFYEMTPTKYRKLHAEKGDRAFLDKR